MRTRTIVTTLALAIALLAPPAVGMSTASAAPEWADADAATITPGVMMFTAGAQCTANFVFTDVADEDVPAAEPAVYLGYAAHCAGLGSATDTNGCAAGSLPLGTPVEIDGATQPGALAYSSWLAMAAQGEDDANTCSYNDFALVEIHPDDVGAVNPSIPHWGGPVGTNTSGNPFFADVYSYGNSSLRFGISLLSPKQGVSLGTTGGGWTHPVYTATPGIPGDSGSAMLDAQGNASGVLSTVSILPLTGSNNFSDLHRALTYLGDNTNLSVELVEGTETFRPNALPVGL